MDLGWVESLLPLGLSPIWTAAESALSTKADADSTASVHRGASPSSTASPRPLPDGKRRSRSRRYAASPSPNQPRLIHTEESPRRARIDTTERLAAAKKRGGRG